MASASADTSLWCVAEDLERDTFHVQHLPGTKSGFRPADKSRGNRSLCSSIGLHIILFVRASLETFRTVTHSTSHRRSHKYSGDVMHQRLMAETCFHYVQDCEMCDWAPRASSWHLHVMSSHNRRLLPHRIHRVEPARQTKGQNSTCSSTTKNIPFAQTNELAVPLGQKRAQNNYSIVFADCV